MNRMGRWILRSLGISFQSTKQSELFIVIKKQFAVSTACKKYSVDKIVVVLLGLTEYFNVKFARSRLGKGDYTLREHLISYYKNDVDVPPESLSIDQAIAKIKRYRTGLAAEVNLVLLSRLDYSN